ncbi:MAG: TIGR02710 family CRISPR-associated CARF protein [Bacillota bacterium]|nr:TIGR02710 family CRISPR-associated CARF protein [Bacillota bacterium]
MKALVISVGGSPEGQAKTILELKPQTVVFFASQASVENVSLIKGMCPGLSFGDRKALVDDETDLPGCYQKAREALRLAIDKAGSVGEVAFDFTGGTKVMSAALVLAGGEVGAKPFYVGGTRRNKDGLGVVVSGSETLTKQANPWDAFAVPEQRRAALLFNHGRIEAARETMAGVCARSRSPGLQEWAKIAVDVMEFYVHWDAFRHGEAVSALRTSKAQERLRVFSAAVGGNRLDELREGIGRGVQYVQELVGVSRGGKFLTPLHVRDVLANAKRRASEGRWDDAVARLYRALEMAAQVQLASKHGLNSEKIDEARVPKERRQAVEERLGPPPWSDLGLWKSFALLNELRDELGARFFAAEEDISKILDVRNHSILAHGVRAVDAEVFKRFLDTVMRVAQIPEAELPTFPEWPEEVN